MDVTTTTTTTATAEDVSKSLTAADYGVVAVYVVASVVVGVFFSRGSSKSNSNYFLAGKGANKFVTGISLISGLTSGISFLGVPGFTYTHGVGMLSFVGGYAIALPFVLWIAIPFFARPELGFTTAYNYLEVRFNRAVRILGALTFLLRSLVYMGFVLYAPALALQAVARVKILYTVLICGIMATLYTCKGGMSAVIWTDFMASIALIAGVCVALGFAVEHTHGSPWEIAKSNGAVTPSNFFDIDPISQINCWNMGLGFAFNTAAQSGTDQIAVQRYLATANVRSARTSANFGILGNTVMMSLLVFLGLSLNSFFNDRYLPSTIKKNTDQIFPYFFTNELPNGVAGLIVAALFATTMSVFSGGINAAVTCFIVDILQSGNGAISAWSKSVSTVKLARITTVLFGVFAIVVAYLAQFIDIGLSEIVSIAQAVCCAPTFGMFLLGMLSQRANSKDVLIGFTFSVLVLVYCLVGASVCPDSSSDDSSHSGTENSLKPECYTYLKPARVSKWMYALVGTLACVFAGLISMFARGAIPPPAHKIMGLTWGTRKVPLLVEVRNKSVMIGDENGEEAEDTPLLLN